MVAGVMLLALALVTALLSAPPAQASAYAGTWKRPVAGALLRAFSLSADHYAPGQHRGVDLAAPLGSTVRAACGGRVSFAGSVPRGGRTVSVRCGRLVATYQQLGSIALRRGRVAAPGAPLGTVGRSADPRSRRPHLHLGAREAATGRYIDPLTLLGDGARPLPLVPAGRAPARRPLPLGPAPARPLAQPEARRAPALQAARAPARLGPVAESLPWTVWTGLLCFGLGLPLGGLVGVRRRRRRQQQQRAATPLAQAAS